MAKKSSPKKKKTAHQRIDELEKKIKSLETLGLVAAPAFTETITYEVRFFGGAGQILLVGQNLNRTETGNDTFTVNQSPGSKQTVVGGVAPAGANGRIEVEVRQGNAILSPFADNVFKGMFTHKIILYAVN